MATDVTFNGNSYTVPAIGEEDWGGTSGVDGLLIALAQESLQKSGGLFTLSNDLDYGATAGIKVNYIKSRSANISTAGVLRFANSEGIGFRNNANSGNLLLTVNSSDQLQFNNSVLITTTASLTASRALVTDASAVITTSAVTATEQGYLSGVTSAIQTQLNTKLTASSTDTLTNKSFTDSTCLFVDESDPTKKFALQVSGISPSTTRTWTVPDASDTMVGLAVSQTLTNKTLTSPVVNGIRVADQASSSNVTAVVTDTSIRVSASGGSRTVDLFTAVGNQGKLLVIKKTDSSFNTVLIDPSGSETINGSATTTLNTEGETLTIISDGANWVILGRYIPSTPTSFTPTFGAGMGTCTAVLFEWSRDGAYITIKGSCTAGTVSGSAMNVTLPTGLTHAYANDQVAEGLAISSYSNAYHMAVLLTSGANTSMSFTKNNAASGFTPIVGNANMVNSSAFSMLARFRITGWLG